MGLSLLSFFSILRVDFSFPLGFPLLCRCFYGPWGACCWLLFYFSLSGGSTKNLWFISKRVLCIFSLKRFTVIIPPFRFLIDFEFVFLYGVRELSWFHSLFPGLRSFRLILHGGCPHFTLLPSVYEGSLFSTASPGLTGPRLLKKGQSGQWEAIPHYNLDLHFSKMSGGETSTNFLSSVSKTDPSRVASWPSALFWIVSQDLPKDICWEQLFFPSVPLPGEYEVPRWELCSVVVTKGGHKTAAFLHAPRFFFFFFLII